MNVDQVPAQLDLHILDESKRGSDRNRCPVCGSRHLHVENFDEVWRDGDVFCDLGHYVRAYDSF